MAKDKFHSKSPEQLFHRYLQNTYCFVGFLSNETLIDSIYKSSLHIFRTRPCKKHGSFFERVMKGTVQSRNSCLLAITLHIILYRFNLFSFRKPIGELWLFFEYSLLTIENFNTLWYNIKVILLVWEIYLHWLHYNYKSSYNVCPHTKSIGKGVFSKKV